MDFIKNKEFNYLVTESKEYDWFNTKQEAENWAKLREKNKQKTYVTKIEEYWFAFVK